MNNCEYTVNLDNQSYSCSNFNMHVISDSSSAYSKSSNYAVYYSYKNKTFSVTFSINSNGKIIYSGTNVTSTAQSAHKYNEYCAIIFNCSN